MRRLLPFSALLLLPAVASAASSVPLKGAVSPEGTAVIYVDPFGGFDAPPSTFDATDPTDPKKTLGPQAFHSGQALSIYGLGPAAGTALVLRDVAFESTSWGFFLDASDLKIFDPATDVVTGNSRTTHFNLGGASGFGTVKVDLDQVLQGTVLTQTYSFTNSGPDLDILVDVVADVDIDFGSNFSDWGFHDARFPGASLGAGQAITITELTKRIGATVALSGGTADGYRTIRAAAPGWEYYRLPTFKGYPASALNGLFTFPAANFLNGYQRPFDEEIPDDVDADGVTDSPGDVALGLQNKLLLPQGVSVKVVLTTTLFSGGPYITAPTCPLPDAKVLSDVDIPLATTSAFGKVSFSVASGNLPMGLTINGSSVQGAPQQGGDYAFTLVATDESGNVGKLDCNMHVVASCGDGLVTEAGEECDDGNTSDGDGCSSTCKIDLCDVQPNPVVCQAADVCHVVGTCDLLTGVCSTPNAPEGAPCDDGQSCTDDGCVDGACVGVNRPDGAPCTADGVVGQCFAGACIADPLENGGNGSGATGTSSGAAGSGGGNSGSGAGSGSGSGAGTGGAANGGSNGVDGGLRGGGCALGPARDDGALGALSVFTLALVEGLRRRARRGR